MKRLGMILSVFTLVFLFVNSAWAAVGCSLNDPDRDVKRIFPDSTGYKTTFVTIKEKGGEVLKKEVEKELADKLEPVYESLDVPYAFYTVLKGKDPIGYIHGVNQKGKYGGMQLIVATDVSGKIVNFYYQKMSSPEAGTFMASTFTSQFHGLALDDFIKGNVSVSDPSANSPDDFRATLRGLRKNMILLYLLLVTQQ
jgi:hypothetical protein